MVPVKKNFLKANLPTRELQKLGSFFGSTFVLSFQAIISYFYYKNHKGISSGHQGCTVSSVLKKNSQNTNHN